MYQYVSAYLRNMAMPMCVMLRLMVFHDLVMTNTSRSVSGTLMDSLSSVRLRRRPSSPVIVHWLGPRDPAPGPRDAASLPIGRTCIELAIQPTVIPISTIILPQSSIRYVVLFGLVACQIQITCYNEMTDIRLLSWMRCEKWLSTCRTLQPRLNTGIH